MGLESLEILQSPISISTFSIIFFIIGYILVLALEKLKIILKNNNTDYEEEVRVEYI